jgi:hypothetical protein
MTGFGVVSGPRGPLGRLWHRLTRRYTRGKHYAVLVDDAIEALEKKSPDAAAWWREYLPHLIGTGQTFGFAAEVCEEIAEPRAN